MDAKENDKSRRRKINRRRTPRSRRSSADDQLASSEPFKLKIKLSNDEFRFLSMLESLTGVLAYDCIYDIERNWLIFVIPARSMKKVIGPGGTTVQALSQHLKKNIDFIAFSRNKIEFIKNMFIPVPVKNIQFYSISPADGGKRMVIYVESEFHRRKIYSQDGRIIKRCELLVKRYFEIEEIVVKVK